MQGKRLDRNYLGPLALYNTEQEQNFYLKGLGEKVWSSPAVSWAMETHKDNVITAKVSWVPISSQVLN